MTRYSDLWHDERRKVLRLQEEAKEITRQRDQYLAFIRETNQQDAFLRWLAPKVGLILETPEQEKSQMSFDDYVTQIQVLAEKCGATEPGKPYCEAEAWRDAFNDGLTPSEAWHEECLAAAEMLG